MKLASFRDSNDPSNIKVGLVEDDKLTEIIKKDDSFDMLSCLKLLKENNRDLLSKKGNTYNLDEIELLQPVIRPSKILAIGLNYKDHIKETGFDTPNFPMFFNKQLTSVNKPFGEIHLPRVSDKLDYEGEMGFIIGRNCRHVPKEEAHKVIAGFVVCNDVSVRDWQMKSQTFTLGKSFDTHSPFGPYIVTPDEVGDPHQLDIKTWVNGEIRQDSNTRHLVFDCYDQIETLTKAFTLEAGDLIMTGTPAGVGIGFKPMIYLKENDVVKIEIENIGVIENKVIKEPETTKLM